MDEILALCKTIGPNVSSSPALVIDLIQRALSAKDLYHFVELDHELMKHYSLAQQQPQPEIQPWLKVLEIFTFGTWDDYKNARTNDNHTVAKLNDAQVMKLKQLSLVTMASESRILDFDSLTSCLDISEDQLGSFLVDCIYSGVVEGFVDSKERILEVQGSVGRDVTDKRLAEISSLLEIWVTQTSEALEEVRRAIQV